MTAIADPYGPGVGSYNRMEVLLGNLHHMPIEDWLIQFGEAWSACDNIGLYWADLNELIPGMSRQQLDLLMTDQEREFHRQLPDRVQVWRGCYEFNADGLSWSLSREIAAGFTRLGRYHHPEHEPMLLSGWVNRDEIAVKLDRNEQEVIAWNVADVTRI